LDRKLRRFLRRDGDFSRVRRDERAVEDDFDLERSAGNNVRFAGRFGVLGQQRRGDAAKE
jgi:hypothetical protein